MKETIDLSSLWMLSSTAPITNQEHLLVNDNIHKEHVELMADCYMLNSYLFPHQRKARPAPPKSRFPSQAAQKGESEPLYPIVWPTRKKP